MKDGLEPGKALVTVTVGEFADLLREILHEGDGSSRSGHRLTACGLNELAGHLGCGRSKVSELRRRGVLDEAVISDVGRQTVFDVETALKLVAGQGRKKGRQ